METPGKLSVERGLVPLSEQQREAYPHIIYQEISDSPEANTILVEALETINRTGVSVIADLDTDESTGALTAVVRSASAERHELAAESALLHGVTRAISLKVEERRDIEAEGLAIDQFAGAAAESLVKQMRSDPELYDEFCKYYGGLRWGTDQEKLISALFIHSAEYDAEELEKTLTGDDVVRLIYRLEEGIDIPYSTHKNWRDLTPAEIFQQAPQLDYRQLEDPGFRSSPEGQQLEEGYRSLMGAKTAERFHRYPREISDEGVAIPKPLIPLSQFPIIEALVVDEVSLSKPRTKYHFGPSEVDALIINSDSARAQQALVEAISTRLPKQERYVFDGPDEFEHKRGMVSTLIHGYKAAYGDTERQNQLKTHLLSALKAFVESGEIARSVREEYQASLATGYLASERAVRGVKDIVTDIMTVGLASPDAEEFIACFMPDFDNSLVLNTDPLALDSNQLKLLVINALGYVNEYSHPHVLGRIAGRVFQDSTIGAKFKEFTDLRAQASKMYRDPQVLLARKAFSKATLSLKKDDKENRARQALDEATAPADRLIEEARKGLNSLLLEYLNTMVDSGQLKAENDQGRLFDGLVRHISFGDAYHMEVLPWEYGELIKLAERPEVADYLKSRILWRIAEQFKYGSEKNRRLVMPVILDIYRVLLGPAASMRLPSSETSIAISSADVIAENSSVFKFASQEDLQLLARYKMGLADLLERVSVGMLKPAAEEEIDSEALEKWQKETVKNILATARSVKTLQSHYEKYLHLQEVRNKPNVYYPWLMQQLTPFWQKMQWEVGPSNRPGRDISELHRVLKDHIAHRLILHEGEYPEDFDPFDGALDSLLLECYERMALNREIQYNSTVWQEGLGFLHYAVAFMPQAIIDQFKTRHGDNPRYKQFIAYLEREHARWNKEDES